MYPSTSSSVVQQPYLSHGVRPFVCTYTGCTAAYKHRRHLRTHEVEKHGRKRKFIKGSLNDWMDSLLAASTSSEQGGQPQEGGAVVTAHEASPVLDPEMSGDKEEGAIKCVPPPEKGPDQDTAFANQEENVLCDQEEEPFPL